MASIQPRSGKFRVSVCINGVRESATRDTRSAARAWGKQREVEIPREALRVKTRLTLAEAIERNLPERDDKREINTLKRLARDLPCAGRSIRKITSDELQEWVKARLKAGVKGSTVNRELNVLAGVYKQFEVPFKVARPENPPPRVRRISEDEIERVCALLGQCELATIFLLAIETGMRQSEILRMTWQDVHLAACYVHVPKSKNGDARDVALSTRAVELIPSPPSTTNGDTVWRLTSVQADHQWRAACKKAGLVDLHFHDSRHEACTRLARRIPVEDLARMLGWRDINSLMIYYNPTASEIAPQLG